MKPVKKNTPKLWDALWEVPVGPEEDRFNIVKEESNIRWQRIERIVLERFKTFNNLRVIEIGAGTGTHAALMAKRGAKVTVFDYSEQSLKRGAEFFSRNGLSAEFVLGNALNLSAEQIGKYDISMSFGLAEHFSGLNRIKVIKAHFDVLDTNGISFVSVPNRINLPYRMYKFFAELKGSWPVEEYPFSRRELRDICAQINVKRYFFFGDSIFWSLNWLYWLTYKANPLVYLDKIRGKGKNVDISTIKKEKGTCLDEWLSYALVLCGEK